MPARRTSRGRLEPAAAPRLPLRIGPDLVVKRVQFGIFADQRRGRRRVRARHRDAGRGRPGVRLGGRGRHQPRVAALAGAPEAAAAARRLGRRRDDPDVRDLRRTARAPSRRARTWSRTASCRASTGRSRPAIRPATTSSTSPSGAAGRARHVPRAGEVKEKAVLVAAGRAATAAGAPRLALAAGDAPRRERAAMEMKRVSAGNLRASATTRRTARCASNSATATLVEYSGVSSEDLAPTVDVVFDVELLPRQHRRELLRAAHPLRARCP